MLLISKKYETTKYLKINQLSSSIPAFKQFINKINEIRELTGEDFITYDEEWKNKIYEKYEEWKKSSTEEKKQITKYMMAYHGKESKEYKLFKAYKLNEV